MWGQIYRAWKLSRNKPERRERLNVGIRLLILILLLFMGFSLLYNFSLANYSPIRRDFHYLYTELVNQTPPP